MQGAGGRHGEEEEVQGDEPVVGADWGKVGFPPRVPSYHRWQKGYGTGGGKLGCNGVPNVSCVGVGARVNLNFGV